MTHIFYDPAGPEMRFAGHAGAKARGGDPVCAALSALLYTLIEAARPEEAALRPGFARVRGGRRAAYRVVAAGLRRLAREYPECVRWQRIRKGEDL